MSTLNIFQTSLNAVSTDVPPIELDGVNLLPRIQADQPAHDYLFFRKGYNHSIRSADYKLTWNTETGDTLMYHIQVDPYEKVNIYGHEANAEKEALIRAYSAWEQKMVSPRWPALIDFRYEDQDKHVYWFEN